MCPLLATPSTYDQLCKTGLNTSIPERLRKFDGRSGPELLRAIAAHSAELNCSAQFIRELSSLLRGIPDLMQCAEFILKHRETIGRFLVPSEFQADSRLVSAAAIFAIYEAPLALERSCFAWRGSSAALGGAPKAAQQRFTKLSCSTHGDVSLSQATVDLKSSSRTVEDLGLVAELTTITLSQEAAPFLIAAIRYAEALKQIDIPELSEYPRVIREVRSNAWGMPDFDSPARLTLDLDVRDLVASQLFSRESIRGQGLFLFSALRGTQKTNVAAEFKDGELRYLVRQSDGTERLAGVESGRYACLLTLGRDDLPLFLRGIYRTYARRPQEMLEILRQLVGPR